MRNAVIFLVSWFSHVASMWLWFYGYEQALPFAGFWLLWMLVAAIAKGSEKGGERR